MSNDADIARAAAEASAASATTASQAATFAAETIAGFETALSTVVAGAASSAAQGLVADIGNPNGVAGSVLLATVAKDVPPLVAQAIAADSTVVEAAAEAVDGALDDAGILGGVGDLHGAEGLAVSFADDAGRRSWLEVLAGTGGPSAHAVELLNDAGAGGDPALRAAPLADHSGYVAAFVDPENRVALGIQPDGSVVIPKFSETTRAAIKAAAGSEGPGPLIAVGDSMTAGAGGTPYTTGLGDDLGTGRTVVNLGYGGQGSASIAGRLGARPYLMTASGNVIPASGPVSMSSPHPDPGTLVGSIAGIPGTLVITGTSRPYTMTFTRAAPGVETACPPNTPFFTGDEYRNRQVISWMGRNGFSVPGAKDLIVADTRAALEWAGPMASRSLVLGITPWADETPGTAIRTTLDQVNAALRDTFPHQWVDVPGRLRTVAALATEGITATTQDLADIANEVTPTSFRASGDLGHYNTAGYRHVRRIIAAELIARKAN